MNLDRSFFQGLAFSTSTRPNHTYYIWQIILAHLFWFLDISLVIYCRFASIWKDKIAFLNRNSYYWQSFIYILYLYEIQLNTNSYNILNEKSIYPSKSNFTGICFLAYYIKNAFFIASRMCKCIFALLAIWQNYILQNQQKLHEIWYY